MPVCLCSCIETMSSRPITSLNEPCVIQLCIVRSRMDFAPSGVQIPMPPWHQSLIQLNWLEFELLMRSMLFLVRPHFQFRFAVSNYKLSVAHMCSFDWSVFRGL